MSPKISVITPLYNCEKYIQQTIDSVLAQTFKDFEWIIINDGSKDKSLEIVRTIDDKRVKVITQKNAGAAMARNTGIANSQGKYIAFLDSDDIWHKDMLQEGYKIISSSEHPQLALNISYYMFQDDDIFYLSPQHGFDGHIDSIKRFYPHLLTPSSTILSRSIIDDIGDFDTSWYYHEDYSFFIKLVEKYPVISSSKRLMYYRYYIDSKGTRCLDNFEYKNSYATILEKYFEETDKEYEDSYKQKAYDNCYKSEIFLLLSLKNNIPMAKKVYKEKINDKKAFATSIRGLFILLSLYSGINFVMPIRKFVQKCYLFYFKYINKIRIS